MKLSTILIPLFTTLFFMSAPANAQSGANSDIGDIFGDIFKGNRGNQTQYPSRSMIENIPVTIRFNTRAKDLPEQATLIVSAFAPPAPNVRRSSPLMIGETRILLSGLRAPLELVIAAPSSVTREIDYARIEAQIIDRFGKPIYELRQSGEYRGAEAPILYLEPIGQYPSNPQTPNPQPVHGTVDITGIVPQFNGSHLVVRLREDGLAGGNGQRILGKTRLSLDGKSVPFSFSFARTEESTRQMPLVIEAWIEDWAGRKTHTMPQAMQFNGDRISYRLPLQKVSNTPSTPQGTGQYIQGEARFNAYKGLPAGSVLIAELDENTNRSRPSNMARAIVKLDGLSGNVPFTFDLLDQRIDPQYINAVIRVRIESKNGQVFFSNPGGTPLTQGFNAVKLRSSPAY